jgi:hypothetical protein
MVEYVEDKDSRTGVMDDVAVDMERVAVDGNHSRLRKRGPWDQQEHQQHNPRVFHASPHMRRRTYLFRGPVLQFLDSMASRSAIANSILFIIIPPVALARTRHFTGD